MDSLYQRGEATVLDIQKDLPDPPTDSAIRAMLRLLENKNQVRRTKTTRPQVYAPIVNRSRAGRGAVRHLVDTFFEGSRERAIHAILTSSERKISRDEVKRLKALIDAARAEDSSNE